MCIHVELFNHKLTVGSVVTLVLCLETVGGSPGVVPGVRGGLGGMRVWVN